MIQVVKIGGAYLVIEGNVVHASYSFSSISPTSETYARLRAEAWMDGYLYARAVRP